jgi:hypothetical protein
MNYYRRVISISFIGIAVFIIILCGNKGGDKNTVVIYTSEDRVFREPVLKDFEKQQFQFKVLHAGQEDLKLINNMFMNVVFWYNNIA